MLHDVISNQESSPSAGVEVASLVRAAQTAGSAQAENAAIARLAPLIRKIGGQVLWGLGNPTGVDFADFISEAPTWLWAKLDRYDETKGSFEAWCWRVLHNRALTIKRGLKGRMAAFGEGGGDDGARWQERRESPESRRREASGAAKEAQDERFEDIRQALNVYHWGTRHAVDYYAVFLLELRLRLAHQVARGGYIVEYPAEAIAKLLPFRLEEAARELRTGWLTLGQVWRAVVPAIDAPPFWVETKVLCATVNMGVLRWYQWQTRAKRAAQEAIGEHRWNELFGDWFEQCEIVDSPQEKGGQP